MNKTKKTTLRRRNDCKKNKFFEITEKKKNYDDGTYVRSTANKWAIFFFQ